jgi:type IV pilus assembly protein PilB
MQELSPLLILPVLVLLTLGALLLVGLILRLARPKPPSPEEPATPAPFQELHEVRLTNKNLFDHLIADLNFSGEREALQRKAQELGFGFADLDRVTIAPETLKVVPEHLVKLHRVLPVKRQDTTLWLAMSNPASRQAIEDVAQATGCRVIPVMAVPSAIDEAIAKYYDS